MQNPALKVVDPYGSAAPWAGRAEPGWTPSNTAGKRHMQGKPQPHGGINPHLLLCLKQREEAEAARSERLCSVTVQVHPSSSSGASRLFAGSFSLPVVEGSSSRNCCFQGITFIFLQAEVVPAGKTGELWNKCEATQAQNAPQGFQIHLPHR